MGEQSQHVLAYTQPDTNTIFSVWKFRKDIEIEAAFKRLCELIINLNNSAYIRFPGKGVDVVMGIGYEAWKRLYLSEPMPKELAVFEPIIGDTHTAVATPGDLHFHLKGNSKSICYDMAEAIAHILDAVADCLEEVHGFRYWDGRSILGFVDGTENPNGEDRAYYGLVGDDDPDYRGGSYVFVQKYIHDLKAFKALPVEEQEKVFGRYKESDIEMTDEVKPTNSHIALTDVGDDLNVIRDNMPFGDMSTNEMGTYFIAYASTFNTVRLMLENMFIGDPPGNYDRLLDFSTAKTGTLFFVPTLDMLENFATEAEENEDNEDNREITDNAATAGEKDERDDSLQIGTLKNFKNDDDE